MGRVTAKLVAGKAKKRAAAQHEQGLLDDDDIAKLGWVEWSHEDVPGDDAVAVTVMAAKAGSGRGAAARGEAHGTEQSAKQRRKSASAAVTGDTAPQSWRAVAADPTSLLMGATEDGFLSLEVRPPVFLAMQPEQSRAAR